MRRRTDGTWFYPLLKEAMTEACIQDLETYISRHHNMAVQYIVISLFLVA